MYQKEKVPIWYFILKKSTILNLVLFPTGTFFQVFNKGTLSELNNRC